MRRQRSRWRRRRVEAPGREGGKGREGRVKKGGVGGRREREREGEREEGGGGGCEWDGR